MAPKHTGPPHSHPTTTAGVRLEIHLQPPARPARIALAEELAPEQLLASYAEAAAMPAAALGLAQDLLAAALSSRAAGGGAQRVDLHFGALEVEG
jgi:hypothetical protein